MSVINQMFEDLERRKHKESVVAGGMENDLKTSARRWVWKNPLIWFLGVAAILIVVGIGVLVLRSFGPVPAAGVASKAPAASASSESSDSTGSSSKSAEGSGGQTSHTQDLASAPREDEDATDEAGQKDDAPQQTELADSEKTALKESSRGGQESQDWPALELANTRIDSNGGRLVLAFTQPPVGPPSVSHTDQGQTVLQLPATRLEGSALSMLGGLDFVTQAESAVGPNGSQLTISPAEGVELTVKDNGEQLILTFAELVQKPAGKRAAVSSVSVPPSDSGSTSDPQGQGGSEKAGTSPADPPRGRIDESVTESALTEQIEDKHDTPPNAGNVRRAESSTRSTTMRSSQMSPPSRPESRVGITRSSDGLHESVRQRLAQGDRAGARSLLDEALVNRPERQDLVRLLAGLNLEEGKAERAVADLEEVAHAEPKTLALLGLAARRAGKMQKAEEAYREALSAFPDRADWWVGLAIAFEGMEQPARALSAYRRALESDWLASQLQAYTRQRIGALADIRPATRQ